MTARWRGVSLCLRPFNVTYSCHCERGEAIHDLERPGLPRYARSDGRVLMLWGGFVAVGVISFLDRYDIRREAADRACARQGEATTCRIDMEME